MATLVQPGESAVRGVRLLVFKSINSLATVTDVFDKLGLNGFIETWHVTSLTSEQLKIPLNSARLNRGITTLQFTLL